MKKNIKFRSGFEAGVFDSASKKFNHNIEYEPPNPPIKYTMTYTYLPDFSLAAGKIFVECKGYFGPRDRKKMLAVKAQNPRLDIRLVFQRANNRLTKSKNSMTYWQWAEKHGFPWAEGEIPCEWLKEATKKHEQSRKKPKAQTSCA